LSGRRFPAILVLLALTYVPLFAVLSQANYNPLVNDYRPYARTTWGEWPKALRAQLDPRHSGEWLYRPLPESVEWAFSEAFREHPGAWHCAILAFRVLMVLLVWMLSGRLSTSAPTRAAVTSYAALFPSFPESQLIYAETQILPLLAAVLLGLASLRTAAKPSRGLLATTAVAFVLLTLCKEILAPMSAALWVALLLALWQWRSRAGLLATVLMGFALLLQGLHAFRAIAAPYAQQNEIVDRGSQVLGNLDWFMGHTLLKTTNLKLTSLVLAGLIAVGALAALRSALAGQWREVLPALAALAALAAVLIVHLPSPYRAIRYVHPAAVLLVPVLALGLDVLGTRWPRARSGIAIFLVGALTVLNAPVLWAQAVAVRNSNHSDWVLLEFLARQRSKDADIALSTEMGVERLDAIRLEISGFWQIPGFTVPRGDGRVVDFAYVPPKPALGRTLVVVLPLGPTAIPDLGREVERRIPPAEPLSFLGRFLVAFKRGARRLNPAYSYPYDLGSSPFPGHSWRVLVKRASSS
jgi:hypothetical protein